MPVEVQHNPSQHRFEVHIDDQLAQLRYQRNGDVIAYTHTEVPPALEGQGIAGQMAKTALDYAKENNLKVLPLCPYVAKYVERHHDWDDILVRE
jgi:uncharacterized protein